jgi:hypothetical protein
MANNNNLNLPVVNITNLNYSNFSNTSEKIAYIRKKYLLRDENGKISPIGFKSAISNPQMMKRIIKTLEGKKENPEKPLTYLAYQLPYLRLVLEDEDIYLSDNRITSDDNLISQLIAQIRSDMEQFPKLKQKEKNEYNSFMGQISARLPNAPPARKTRRNKKRYASRKSKK